MYIIILYEVITILKVNDIINVIITEISASGTGFAIYEDYPLFIAGGVTGDELSVQVTKTNKNYGFAKIVSIQKASALRVNPPCPSFEKCGGCDLMHINYASQLEIKQGYVKNNLKRIAGLNESDYIFDGISGADNEFYYRNKAQFPVAMHNGKAVCGFYEQKTHKVVPCLNCMIQNKEINKTVNIILDFINENKISVYNEKTHKGIVRHIYVRCAEPDGGEIMATVVTNTGKELKNYKDLADKLSAQVKLSGLIQNINTEKSNVILGRKNIVLFGCDTLNVKLDGLSFKISPHSFFQVNYMQMQKLYQKAIEYAQIEKTDTVFDLYCGVGSISLYAARYAKKVVGVEIIDAAVKNAKANATESGIDNAEFFAGDCPEITRELLNNGYSADIVIVDPPRKGCDESLLALINEISPKRLVYVSCNSSTLARDIVILKEYGYTLKKLHCVDMFCQSTHVESVALLTLSTTKFA